MEDYKKILYNIKKLQKYTHFLNTKKNNHNIYNQKINKYNQILVNYGIIQLGGNPLEENKENIDAVKAMIEKQIKLHDGNITKYYDFLTTLKIQHTEILLLLNNIEELLTAITAITKISKIDKEKTADLIDKLKTTKTCLSEDLDYKEKIKDLIISIKKYTEETLIDNYNTELQKYIPRIKELTDNIDSKIKIIE